MTQPDPPSAAVIPIDGPAKKLRSLLHYAKRGWAIFPCYEPEHDGSGACTCRDGAECGNSGKHPRVKGGFNAATTDPERIREWHERWPTANWAVACGASNITVIDVDPRNGGDESLAELEQTHPLPETIRAITGGGGAHYVFRGAVPSAVIADGLDLKSTGGYVIIYPSIHASGREYVWDSGSPEQPAETPDWIRALGSHRQNDHRSAGAVIDGWLGKAFEAAGWLGRPLPGSRQTARCPWEAEHTSGSRHDSSTVLFAPYPGQRIGAFHCSHSHCAHRKLADVVHALPAAARATATRVTGVTPPAAPNMRHVQIEQAIPENVAWRDSLRFNNEGSRLTRDVGNLALLLANMPEWVGCLQYDFFSDRLQWARPVPELPGMDHSAPHPGEELHDSHLLYVRHWFARRWGMTLGTGGVSEACNQAARANTTHPVREYLEATEWDRVPRAAQWLVRYCGALDTPYHRAVGRWWLLSAVARIYRPGCQVDHMLVLEGLRQGEGKSSGLRLLCGEEWFLGHLPDLRSKDSMSALRGRWIVEIGEMDAFRGHDSSRIKDFVSQTVDRYRPAYARCEVSAPRTCVFCGTTNEDTYLSDPTGARRFWPVRISSVDREQLATDRDQIWAEALHYYRCGETWWPDGSELGISEEQEQRAIGDSWDEHVLSYAARQGDSDFTAADLMEYALRLPPRDQTRSAQTRVGGILRRGGYFSRRKVINGRKVAVYRREAR